MGEGLGRGIERQVWSVASSTCDNKQESYGVILKGLTLTTILARPGLVGEKT